MPEGIDSCEEVVERQPLVFVDEEDLVTTQPGDVEQPAQVGGGVLVSAVTELILDDLEHRTGRADLRTRLFPGQCHGTAPLSRR